ncbi:MAG: glutathione-disulfide reductase [Leptospirales bacterium]|nr:glutathione-disulfide reductase [Leptospirales bacterium]
MQTEFDFLVLGGGSGGIAAARRAASYGARVALIERQRLGGTCVNVGCVPKKVMWNAAQLQEAMIEAQAYGFRLQQPWLDFSALKQSRDAYVARLNEIYRSNLLKDGIEIVEASARFVAPGVVEAGQRQLRAPHILIAVGAKPERPELKGAELGESSDDFFTWTELPKSLMVVGAGYIAVELAGALQALGVKVTLLTRGEFPLRHFDAMLGAELAAEYRRKGMQLEGSFTPLRLWRDGGELRLESNSGKVYGAEKLLWAIGRRPNTSGLGLETIGLQCDPKGGIAVDAFQNAQSAGVYAVGDVTNGPALTPVAIAAGRRLADRLFGGQSDARLEYDLIPTVVFSDPPIGAVGLSEQEALAKYGAATVYESRFINMYYALQSEKPVTRMKLICCGDEQRVVGLQVIGRGADEMTQGFAVALRMGARKVDFDRTIAIHPTAAEEFVTMRNARS